MLKNILLPLAWNQFGLILAAGTCGVIAALPYGFALNRDRIADASLPIPVIVIINIFQNTIILVVAISAGLLLSEKVGVGAPQLARLLAGGNAISLLLDILPPALGSGAGVFLVIIAMELVYFKRFIPTMIYLEQAETATWKRLLACLHGGITEEILLRLFVFSMLAWLLGFIWYTPTGSPSAGAFWLANLGAALLFGAWHLPSTAVLTPLSPMIVARALILNGIGGVIFGYLYWQFGLLAAMLGHLTADFGYLMLAIPLFHTMGSNADVHL